MIKENNPLLEIKLTKQKSPVNDFCYSIIESFFMFCHLAVLENHTRHPLVSGIYCCCHHGGGTLFRGVDERTEKPVAKFVNHNIVHSDNIGAHNERIGNVKTDTFLFPCF